MVGIPFDNLTAEEELENREEFKMDNEDKENDSSEEEASDKKKSKNGLCPKKPRTRRTFAELTRDFVCTYGDCKRRYASAHSLQQHIKRKHPHWKTNQVNPTNKPFSSKLKSESSGAFQEGANSAGNSSTNIYQLQQYQATSIADELNHTVYYGSSAPTYHQHGVGDSYQSSYSAHASSYSSRTPPRLRTSSDSFKHEDEDEYDSTSDDNRYISPASPAISPFKHKLSNSSSSTLLSPHSRNISKSSRANRRGSAVASEKLTMDKLSSGPNTNNTSNPVSPTTSRKLYSGSPYGGQDHSYSEYAYTNYSPGYSPYHYGRAIGHRGYYSDYHQQLHHQSPSHSTSKDGRRSSLYSPFNVKPEIVNPSPLTSFSSSCFQSGYPSHTADTETPSPTSSPEKESNNNIENQHGGEEKAVIALLSLQLEKSPYAIQRMIPSPKTTVGVVNY